MPSSQDTTPALDAIPSTIGWTQPGVPTVRLHLLVRDLEERGGAYPGAAISGISLGSFTGPTISASGRLGEGGAGKSVTLKCPTWFAKQLIDYFLWHFCAATEQLAGRTYSNCHTFTAVTQGWLSVHELNPNIVGSGPPRLDLQSDDYEIVRLNAPFSLRPGAAYGIPNEQRFEPTLSHTMTALDPRGDLMLSVAGWSYPIAICPLSTMLDYYGNGQKIASIVEVASKPTILETENWREKVAAFHGGGYDGKAVVRMLDRIIAKKPKEHARFLDQATDGDTCAYQAMQSRFGVELGNLSR